MKWIQTALIAARSLAEFGSAANEALPNLRRAFGAVLKTDISREPAAEKCPRLLLFLTGRIQG
jgi:hypothetical protein